MTKQEFDTHKFSVNTEIEFRREWYKVTEVDLEDGYFGLENGYYLKYDDPEVGGIRN